jgi:sirohydrochlorin cobaltochelatase
MLILVAHGSRNPRWRASIERLTDLLQVDLGADKVRLAYMELAPPTLVDVASDAARAGVKNIRVLPLFLAAEGHVDRNIGPMVDQLREKLEPVEVELLPPIGQHPRFRELIHKIAVEPRE